MGGTERVGRKRLMDEDAALYREMSQLGQMYALRVCTRVPVSDLRNYRSVEDTDFDDAILNYVFCDLTYHAYVAVCVAPDIDGGSAAEYAKEFDQLSAYLDKIGIRAISVGTPSSSEAIQSVEAALSSQLKKYC